MAEQVRQDVTVARIGRLDVSETENIVGIANLCQRMFRFSDVEDTQVDLSPYKLPNGGYDLDSAVEKEILPNNTARPLILLTSEPYGVPDHGEDADWFYFSGEIGSDVSIISSHLWEYLGPERRLQPYLLYMIGTALISMYAGLEFHDETMGCIFDYCDEPEDIDRSLKANRFFCGPCQYYLNSQVDSGRITIDQLVATLRLINRARGVGLTCFISYSHKDEEFAKRLYTRMQREGLQVWMAAKDIGEGKLHEQIEMSIKLYDKLLLVLSEHSMLSEWVKSEIRWAVEAGLQEKTQKLLPIRLVDMDAISQWKYFDTDFGKDLAREIRQYYIHDFSRWRNRKAFEKAFANLMTFLT